MKRIYHHISQLYDVDLVWCFIKNSFHMEHNKKIVSALPYFFLYILFLIEHIFCLLYGIA